MLAATTVAAAVPTVLATAALADTEPAAGRIDWDAITLRVNNATYAAWNAHDPDAIAALLAEDVRTREANEPEFRVGREPVRARAAAILAAFPDFRLERLRLIIDGPRHSDRWKATGTHLGEFMGIPPTGRSIRVEGATFTVIKPNGVVIEDIHHTDNYAVLQQLGVIQA
jgi:steroid delta-isomerase-like uncharacterized protein